MSNQDHILDILNIIKKNYDGSENKAVLIVAVDTDINTALAEYKGDIQVLAQGFGNMMRTKPEFNQLMKALMGAYLSQHPEEKEVFIKGLELVNQTPSQS